MSHWYTVECQDKASPRAKRTVLERAFRRREDARHHARQFVKRREFKYATVWVHYGRGESWPVEAFTMSHPINKGERSKIISKRALAS